MFDAPSAAVNRPAPHAGALRAQPGGGELPAGSGDSFTVLFDVRMFEGRPRTLAWHANMPVHHSVWRIGNPPKRLPETALAVPGPVEPASDFRVITAGRERPALEKAVNETGLFGNTNTVCAPRTPKWRHTIERLKEAFPGYQGPKAPVGIAND